MTAAAFSAQLDAETALVLERMTLFVQKIALQVLRGVVLKTPVDTGRARGNWQVTIGEPAEGEVANLDPSGGSTISEGTARILGAINFVVIWVVNNLPYIERLEDGYSTQAPEGMVVVTLAEIETQFMGLGGG